MELYSRWRQFRKELADLIKIRITSLHAFSEPSKRACRTVICMCAPGGIKVMLLSSKSRLAPVKRITFLRLELSAAALMGHLTNRMKEILNMEISTIHCWTDSQIVLVWIRSRPSSFHIFAANRTTSIQELTNTSNWRHMNMKLNPVDLVPKRV